MSDLNVVHLLDYGAGNVRSVRNAIRALSYKVVDITKPEQIDDSVQKLVFPGVGNFASAMLFLNDKGFAAPLKEYIKADRPFLGNYNARRAVLPLVYMMFVIRVKLGLDWIRVKWF